MSDGIDYEKLAKAAYDESNEQYLIQTGDEWGTSWEESGDDLQAMKVAEARAVIAALREQGMVVVRREDAALLVEAVKEAGKALADASEIDDFAWWELAAPEVVGAVERIAALAAAGEGGEDGDA